MLIRTILNKKCKFKNRSMYNNIIFSHIIYIQYLHSHGKWLCSVFCYRNWLFSIILTDSLQLISILSMILIREQLQFYQYRGSMSNISILSIIMLDIRSERISKGVMTNFFTKVHCKHDIQRKQQDKRDIQRKLTLFYQYIPFYSNLKKSCFILFSLPSSHTKKLNHNLPCLPDLSLIFPSLSLKIMFSPPLL